MNIAEIQTQINRCNGLCVEIGGPSPKGYEFIKELGLKLPRNIIVSNVSDPVILNPFGNSPEEHAVDIVIDIQHLPYKKGEVAMFLTSSLPHKLHSNLFINTAKALMRGGLLIIENELPEDAETVKQLGFTPLLDQQMAHKYFSQIYQLS
jgi:hypothetical protein